MLLGRASLEEGSEYRVLDGVRNELGDLVHWFVCLHVQHHVLESFLYIRNQTVPNSVSLFDDLFLVFRQFNQSARSRLILRRVDFQVVVHSSLWVDSPVGKSP